MDYAVPQMQEMGHLGKSGKYFGRMLGVSLFVHGIVFLLLLSPRHGQFAARPIAYLDLSMTAPAAEASRPAETKKTDTAHQEKAVPVPETAQPSAPTEFDRLQQSAREALETAAAKPEAVGQSSIALGITNGYFSSLAEGQTLHDDIRDYYFTILRAINEKWWVASESHASAYRRAMISVVIGRDGNVVKAEIRQGSGSYSYDKSLLKALEAASPFPPLPKQYRMGYFEAPLVFNPPLNLMGTGNKS